MLDLLLRGGFAHPAVNAPLYLAGRRIVPDFLLARASGWSSRPTAPTTTTRSSGPPTASASASWRPTATGCSASPGRRRSLQPGRDAAPLRRRRRTASGAIVQAQPERIHRSKVGGVVPEPDHAPLALAAELADRGGAEREAAAVGGGEVDPAGSEDAQDVAVGEERDVAAGCPRAGDDAVGAVADVVRGLAVRDAVAARGTSRGGARGSRPWSGPRRRRSRTRAGRRRARRGRRGRPARRSRARGAAGCDSTVAKS